MADNLNRGFQDLSIQSSSSQLPKLLRIITWKCGPFGAIVLNMLNNLISSNQRSVFFFQGHHEVREGDLLLGAVTAPLAPDNDFWTFCGPADQSGGRRNGGMFACFPRADFTVMGRPDAGKLIVEPLKMTNRLQVFRISRPGGQTVMILWNVDVPTGGRLQETLSEHGNLQANKNLCLVGHFNQAFDNPPDYLTDVIPDLVNVWSMPQLGYVPDHTNPSRTARTTHFVFKGGATIQARGAYEWINGQWVIVTPGNDNQDPEPGEGTHHRPSTMSISLSEN